MIVNVLWAQSLNEHDSEKVVSHIHMEKNMLKLSYSKKISGRFGVGLKGSGLKR